MHKTQNKNVVINAFIVPTECQITSEERRSDSLLQTLSVANIKYWR